MAGVSAENVTSSAIGTVAPSSAASAAAVNRHSFIGARRS
jgi:hypothetical protein